jgi:cytochrome oxidase Cu insertion factor (SCO1/SenC/PrrC family)
MSTLADLSRRMRRRLFVAVLPLAILGLLAAPLPTAHAQTDRRRAPELDGAVGLPLGADNPIKLKDLRGKIVVLEFWTLC